MKTHVLRRGRGFTLIEIMIVVVLIGLLAGMAYPAFQHVVQNSVTKTADNDARQIAAASQQYLLENPGALTVSISVNTASGIVTGVLSAYVSKISRGTSVGDFDGSTTPAFSMSYPIMGASIVAEFDGEGKRISSP